MTYRISTYDPNDDDPFVRYPGFSWRVRFSGLTLFGLREPLRELKKLYSPDISILVEREAANGKRKSCQNTASRRHN